MGTGYNGSLKTKPRKAHEVDEVSFADDRAVCVCGWKGPIDEFSRHWARRTH